MRKETEEFIKSELGSEIEPSKLQEVKTYKELLELQNNLVKNKLASERSEKQTSKRISYAFGTLTIGSLLVLAFMLYRMVKKGVKGGLESGK